MSEIIQIGKDSYMMSSSSNAHKSGGELKANLAKEASQFCTKQDKMLLLDGFSEVDMAFGRLGSAEITFRCLHEDDPEYTKANADYKHSPGGNTSTGIGIILPTN
jgi:hypothetical protein